jgi:hypothetical protein
MAAQCHMKAWHDVAIRSLTASAYLTYDCCMNNIARDILTTSRALMITDDQLISLVLDDPQEPELFEDSIDYMVMIILTFSTSPEDRRRLADELRTFMH